jgi:integrase/recombinase XerC
MYHLDQFQEYLLKERRYSTHTCTSYLSDVTYFWQFVGEEIQCQSVDQKLVRRWIAFLSKEGLNHKTINRKISSLKSYFKFLYITNTIEKFPLDGIRNLKTEKKIQIPFSVDEMKEVTRDQFSKDYDGTTEYICVTLFYNLGVRKSELIELKLTDYSGNTFRIMGKGSKERIVPVSEKLSVILDEYLIQRKQIQTEKDKDFFLVKNAQKLNQTFVYRLINNYFRGITSKEKRSPHILRHSFASHLIQNGAEINAVKELMGHASLSSTQVYVNSNIEELKKVYQHTHPRTKKKV